MKSDYLVGGFVISIAGTCAGDILTLVSADTLFFLLSFSFREDFVKIRRVANLIVFLFFSFLFFFFRRNFGYIRPVKFFKYFYIDVTHVNQSRLNFTP